MKNLICFIFNLKEMQMDSTSK